MTAPVKAPPKPTYDPDVHLKPSGARKPPRTLKGDLGKLKGKLSSARTKWADGQKSASKKKETVRKEAGEILTPVKQRVSEEREIAGEVTKPIVKAIETLKKGLDPANGKTRPYVTSFMISSVVSWAIGPQFLLAAYERIKYGTSTTGWGVLQGPGRWFRDTIGMAVETGQMVGFTAAICVGLAPMLLFSVRNMVASHVAQSSYYGKTATLAIKWLARLPWLVPVVFLIGVSYPKYVTALFGAPWVFGWWQVWLAGLFCTAYYCTMWVFDRVEKGLGLGYFHVLLMVPLASIVTGALLYTPGAAW
ncbi:hypothetical protein ACFW2V_12750 [Streptomyces sp. NPDC058947]|uniref:hypothetical protein n=1 Tax=Streptomyces sp. NPDC058947 TaxID=3346675 RepID=UPI0036A782A7